MDIRTSCGGRDTQRAPAVSHAAVSAAQQALSLPAMQAHSAFWGDACREAAERQPPPAPLDLQIAPDDVLLPAGRLSAVLGGTLVVQARALDVTVIRLAPTFVFNCLRFV